MELKALRTSVLADDTDKSSKKLFKEAVKLLEKEEKVSLTAEGVVKLSKSERAGPSNDDDAPKSEKKEKKKKEKKRKRESAENNEDDSEEKDKSAKQKKDKKKKKKDLDESHEIDDNNDDQIDNEDEEEDAVTNEEVNGDNTGDNDPATKNNPCRGNPSGCTRLFLGNLAFAISEPTLNTHLNNTITHVKWITDKTTGKFYGSAFVEMRNSKDAAKALKESNGSLLMGRPLKINYAPPKPGEESDWPPKSKVITGGKLANAGGNGGQAGGKGLKAMSVKPEGCTKLFIGNLSYEIDDEAITKFFMGVEAELKAVRWLYHQDSGDFKGCGYVDFWNTEACEKAAALNGKNLLERPIRIDWAE